MDYRKGQERYANDPAFRQMVDFMVHQINDLQMSPGELRDAAVFAEIKFRMMHQHPVMVVSPDIPPRT